MPTRKASIAIREQLARRCDKGCQVALAQGRCPRPANSSPEEPLPVCRVFKFFQRSQKIWVFMGTSHNSIALQNNVGGKKKVCQGTSDIAQVGVSRSAFPLIASPAQTSVLCGYFLNIFFT